MITTPAALECALRAQREPQGRVYVDGKPYVSPIERERRARQERAIAAAAKALAAARKRERSVRAMIGVSIYGWHTFEVGETRLFARPDNVSRETWLSRISASARGWTIHHGAVFSTKALIGGIQVTRTK